ncbi:hypothetical protein INR49_022856 [Caranx melampygus]|nr:hypothetical protein INR49_022856 [Caranx melampygus]
MPPPPQSVPQSDSSRLEELRAGHHEWSWSTHGRLLQEPQVGDAPQMDHPVPRHQPELLQHKTGKSVSSSCADGWTHYRRRCYILSSSVASWASAERTCSLLFNSSLTSVKSRRDMTWLWKFAGKKHFGSVSLSGGPGRWMWADGRSVSFSRLRGPPLSRSGSEDGSDCVLVENPGAGFPQAAPQKHNTHSSARRRLTLTETLVMTCDP